MQQVQILLQKVELLSTYYNNFSQPATAWFVAFCLPVAPICLSQLMM